MYIKTSTKPNKTLKQFKKEDAIVEIIDNFNISIAKCDFFKGYFEEFLYIIFHKDNFISYAERYYHDEKTFTFSLRYSSNGIRTKVYLENEVHSIDLSKDAAYSLSEIVDCKYDKVNNIHIATCLKGTFRIPKDFTGKRFTFKNY